MIYFNDRCMTMMYVISICFTCMILTYACDVATPTHSFQAQQYNEIETTDLGLPLDSTEAFYLESLSGTWLHWSEVSTCVNIGAAYFEQVNRSLFLVEVEHLPHQNLIETWNACDIELTPIFGQQPQVPDLLKESVYPAHSKQGYALGANEETRYVSGAFVELWGLTLEQPTIDLMPTMADDPRIIDQDQDGNPGVTLNIGATCKAYLTQRSVTHYVGSFEKADVISGEAISKTEQFIIDASSGFCKTPYQTTSNPKRSHFKRIRIDGKGGALDVDLNDDGVIECDEIKKYKTILFESQQIDDESCNPTSMP